jgi:phage terminase small subunit
MAKSLARKQQIFVAEYLTDLNATRAAIAAGYSEKTADQQGSRMLKNVKVAAVIAEKTQKRVGGRSPPGVVLPSGVGTAIGFKTHQSAGLWRRLGINEKSPLAHSRGDGAILGELSPRSLPDDPRNGLVSVLRLTLVRFKHEPNLQVRFPWLPFGFGGGDQPR